MVVATAQRVRGGLPTHSYLLQTGSTNSMMRPGINICITYESFLNLMRREFPRTSFLSDLAEDIKTGKRGIK